MSKTKDKSSLPVLSGKISKVSKGSFEELYDMDEKQVSKDLKRHEKLNGKKVQLLAKINQCQMHLVRAESEYRKSLTDPLLDSVQLAIDIRTLNEERHIAEEILNQLFPNK